MIRYCREVGLDLYKGGYGKVAVVLPTFMGMHACMYPLFALLWFCLFAWSGGLRHWAKVALID